MSDRVVVVTLPNGFAQPGVVREIDPRGPAWAAFARKLVREFDVEGRPVLKVVPRSDGSHGDGP